MKALIAAASLALPALLVPGIANAQPANSAASASMPIVVTAKHKKNWDKGSKMEADGLKELEKAKNNLVGYSADVVEAQNKRDSSRARGENAATEFRRLTTSQSYFSDPAEAARWAKQVEKAASEWAKYDDRRLDGREDLDKGMSRQSKAQASVDKAQNKVDRGRAMKREAERLSSMGGNR